MRSSNTSTLEKWIQKIQNSWLQVLVLVNKDTASTSAGVLISEFISLLQLLAVPVAVVLEIQRRTQGVAQTAMTEVLFGLSVVNPDSTKQVFGETVFLVIFVLAMLSVMAFVVMALVVGITVASKTAKHSPLLLRTLRATAKLSATALFLPWTSLLLQSLGCEGNMWWGGAGVPCYGALHSTIAVVVIILLPFFIAASLSVASVYIDRNPVSEQLDARSHGRADVLLLTVKMMLTALLTFGTTTAPEWLILGLLFAAGGLWLYLFATMLPYASLPMNAAHVGMATSFLWASTAGVIAWASGGKEDVGLLVVLGTPLAGVMGFTAAYSRFNASIRVDDPYTIFSMWTVVLWTRERLRASANFSRRSDSLHGAMLAGSSDDGSPIPVAISAEAARWGLTVDRSKTLSQQLEEAATTGIEALEDVFSANGIAHSVASSFWAATSQLSHYKERQALTLARGISRAFDIDFFFYQSLENMQSTDNNNNGSSGSHGKRSTMSVVDRVLFDQHKLTALESEAECFAVHVLLMKHVATRQMDISFLHTHLGARLDEAMRTATNSFDSMLRINAESPEALNSAAEFHLQLAGNTTRASELFKRASRIEENNRRAKERKVVHVAFGSKADDDLSPTDEQNASFTISTDRSRLGEIVAVNAAAIRMFGSNSLLGSNIDCILPNGPLREVHDSFLAKFVQTGTSAFLDSTRILIAQHNAGYLFPIRFRIFETPPSAEDMRPKLTGLIAPVTTDEGFLVIGDESYDYTILSVCLKTASVLQRPVDALSEQNVPAALIFPQLFGTAGQGGMVDDDGPAAHPTMQRVESRASQGFGASNTPRRRRPGSARSYGGGSVAPPSQAENDHSAPGPTSSHHRHGAPTWLEGFPKALIDSFKVATPVNLFVPALLSEDDFEGGDGSDDSETDAGSMGSMDNDWGHGTPLNHLSRVQEVEEDDAGSDGADSMGAAGSESDDGRSDMGSDSDGDPATKRVEPHVLPVTVRCYALPKRTATMPTGIVITWSRAAGEAKSARTTVPASRPPMSSLGSPPRRDGVPPSGLPQSLTTAAAAAASASASAGAADATSSIPPSSELPSKKPPSKGVVIISPSDGEPFLPGAAGISGDSDEVDRTSLRSPPSSANKQWHRTMRSSGDGDSSGGVAGAGILTNKSRQSRGPIVPHSGAPSPKSMNKTQTLMAARKPLQPRQDVSEEEEDPAKTKHAMIRRSLKRTLDLMTKQPSPGVLLMRRALWTTTFIFFVLTGATLGALGPWTTTINLHAGGIRHAGHVIEHLHQSNLIVEIMSSEEALTAATGSGWPTTSYPAVVDQLHRMPARLNEAIHVFYSDIQALGGSLVDFTTSADRVAVLSESGLSVAAVEDVSGEETLSGRRTAGARAYMQQASVADRILATSAESSTGDRTVQLSLFDSLQAVQQALEALSKQNKSTLTASDPDVKFILENARHRIGNVVNVTLETKAFDLGVALGGIEAIELYTFAIVISVTVFGQLIISIMASGYLWREQTALMAIFYNIPSKLARAMASRAEAQLRKHRRHTASLTGNDEDGGFAEDSDDSVERQREEGEEIRWQLMVERLARIAQEDYAMEQAASQGVTPEVYLKQRRITRSSIALDSIQAGKFAAAAAAGAGGKDGVIRSKTSGSGGRSGSRSRRGSSDGRGRRSSGAGHQNMGRSKRGDAKLRAEMARERRTGLRMKDSTGTRMLLMMLSLAPSLLIAGWFATVYSLDIAMHQRVLIEAERLVHLQQLSVWSGELAHTVADAAFLPEVRDNQTLQLQLTHDAEIERIAMVSRASLVQHGGISTLTTKLQQLTGLTSPALTPLDELNPLQALLNSDGCSAVVLGVSDNYYEQQAIVTNSTCHVAHSGVLARGMTVAVAALLSNSRAVEGSFTQLWHEQESLNTLLANVTLTAQNAAEVRALQHEVELLSKDVTSIAGTVLQLYDPWLRAGLLALEKGIVDALSADISSTWDLQRNISIAFMVLFIFSVFFVFAPRLGWVQRIVSATRRMLLVVPDDVLVGFPLLGEAVKELETALSSKESVASKLGSSARGRRASITVKHQRPQFVPPSAILPSQMTTGSLDGTVHTGQDSGSSLGVSRTLLTENPSELSVHGAGGHRYTVGASKDGKVSAITTASDEGVSSARHSAPPMRAIDAKDGRSLTDLSAVNSDRDAAILEGVSGDAGAEIPLRGIEVGGSADSRLAGSSTSQGGQQVVSGSVFSPVAVAVSPAGGDSEADEDAHTGNPIPPMLR